MLLIAYANLAFVMHLGRSDGHSCDFCPDSGHYDVVLMVSGVYIHENLTEVKKDSGIVKFGFYESTFFYAEYPR